MSNPFKHLTEVKTPVQGFKIDHNSQTLARGRPTSLRQGERKGTVDFYHEKFKQNKRKNEIVAQVMSKQNTLKRQQSEKDKRFGSSSSTANKHNPSVGPQFSKGYRIKAELYRSKPVPAQIRKDPFAEIPVLTLDDLNKGLYTLVNQGYLGKHVDITQALQRNKPLICAKKIEDNVVLFNDSILELNLTDNKIFATDPLSKPGSGDHSQISYKTRTGVKQGTTDTYSEMKATTKSGQQTMITVPKIDIEVKQQRSFVQHKTERSKAEKKQEQSKREEENFVSSLNSKFIEVLNGDLKKDENFLKLRSLNLMIWGDIEEVIQKVVAFATGQRVMTFRIYLHKVKVLSSLMRSPIQSELVGCIENYKKIREFVTKCFTKVDQSSDNTTLMVKVCTKIQKNFRKMTAQRLVKKLADIQNKIKMIQFQIRLKYIHQETVRRTAKNNAEKYSFFTELNKRFVESWDDICSKHRVEVHINSLSNFL